MRIASHGHQLLCRVGKVGMNCLRQMTDTLRQFTQAPSSLIAASDGDRSNRRLSEAGNDVEQCALSGSIHADECKELAWRRFEGDGTQYGTVSVRECDIFD